MTDVHNLKWMHLYDVHILVGKLTSHLQFNNEKISAELIRHQHIRLEKILAVVTVDFTEH